MCVQAGQRRTCKQPRKVQNLLYFPALRRVDVGEKSGLKDAAKHDNDEGSAQRPHVVVQLLTHHVATVWWFTSPTAAAAAGAAGAHERRGVFGAFQEEKVPTGVGPMVWVDRGGGGGIEARARQDAFPGGWCAWICVALLMLDAFPGGPKAHLLESDAEEARVGVPGCEGLQG